MSQASHLKLPKRLGSIQALRGVAALLVLLFHLAAFQREMAMGNAVDIALTTGLWDRGWAGVDLFFVISGFIMVYVTRETGRSLGDVRSFLTSRITRIYSAFGIDVLSAKRTGELYFISHRPICKFTALCCSGAENDTAAMPLIVFYFVIECIDAYFIAFKNLQNRALMKQQ